MFQTVIDSGDWHYKIETIAHEIKKNYQKSDGRKKSNVHQTQINIIWINN